MMTSVEKALGEARKQEAKVQLAEGRLKTLDETITQTETGIDAAIRAENLRERDRLHAQVTQWRTQRALEERSLAILQEELQAAQAALAGAKHRAEEQALTTLDGEVQATAAALGGKVKALAEAVTGLEAKMTDLEARWPMHFKPGNIGLRPTAAEAAIEKVANALAAVVWRLNALAKV